MKLQNLIISFQVTINNIMYSLTYFRTTWLFSMCHCLYSCSITCSIGCILNKSVMENLIFCAVFIHIGFKLNNKTPIIHHGYYTDNTSTIFCLPAGLKLSQYRKIKGWKHEIDERNLLCLPFYRIVLFLYPLKMSESSPLENVRKLFLSL